MLNACFIQHKDIWWVFVWEVAEDNDRNTKTLFFFPFTAHMQYIVIVLTVLLTFKQTGKRLSVYKYKHSDYSAVI